MIKPKKRNVKTPRSFDEQMMGVEPSLGSWADQDSWSDEEYKIALIKSGNWYNYFFDAKTGRRWLMTYLKNQNASKKTLAAVRSYPDKMISSTLCIYANMANNGFVMRSETLNWMQKKISEVTDKYAPARNTKSPKTVEKTVSVQERTKEISSDLIGEIETAIDNFVNNKTPFEMFSWLKSNEIKPIHANRILAAINPQLDEAVEASSGKDDELSNAYAWMGKRKLNSYVKFLKMMVTDIEAFVSTTKVTRKPRKRKEKPVSKIVALMNFQPESSEYKVASIPPERIIGAEQLFVFNTKYRKLTVFNAINRDGLQIHRSRITNFDEETSFTKKVRKPEDILPNIVGGKKRSCKNAWDSLKVKTYAAGAQINKDTILLKVM